MSASTHRAWILCGLLTLSLLPGCSKKYEAELVGEIVQEQPQINEVSYDLRDRRASGGGVSVDVEIQGDPGLTATFDISDGIADHVRMNEVRDGVYVGSHALPSGNAGFGPVTVTGRLSHPEAGETTATASTGLRVALYEPPPPPPPPVEETACARLQQQLLEATVRFKVDSYWLNDEARSALGRVASLLKQTEECSFTVEGHCDERPGPNPKYNYVLGMNRALAVVSFLVEAGIPRERMNPVSFGATQPVDTGNSEEAWARNRRVEFRVGEGG